MTISSSRSIVLQESFRLHHPFRRQDVKQHQDQVLFQARGTKSLWYLSLPCLISHHCRKSLYLLLYAWGQHRLQGSASRGFIQTTHRIFLLGFVRYTDSKIICTRAALQGTGGYSRKLRMHEGLLEELCGSSIADPTKPIRLVSSRYASTVVS
ncbi:hypothetical protein KCU89_g148, partial [Aureobasidium melanogenum]